MGDPFITPAVVGGLASLIFKGCGLVIDQIKKSSPAAVAQKEEDRKRRDKQLERLLLFLQSTQYSCQDKHGILSQENEQAIGSVEVSGLQESVKHFVEELQECDFNALSQTGLDQHCSRADLLQSDMLNVSTQLAILKAHEKTGLSCDFRFKKIIPDINTTEAKELWKQLFAREENFAVFFSRVMGMAMVENSLSAEGHHQLMLSRPFATRLIRYCSISAVHPISPQDLMGIDHWLKFLKQGSSKEGSCNYLGALSKAAYESLPSVADPEELLENRARLVMLAAICQYSSDKSDECSADFVENWSIALEEAEVHHILKSGAFSQTEEEYVDALKSNSALLLKRGDTDKAVLEKIFSLLYKHRVSYPYYLPGELARPLFGWTQSSIEKSSKILRNPRVDELFKQRHHGNFQIEHDFFMEKLRPRVVRSLTPEDETYTVAVIGAMKVGKSTFLSSIISEAGAGILPSRSGSGMTQVPTIVTHNPKQDTPKLKNFKDSAVDCNLKEWCEKLVDVLTEFATAEYEVRIDHVEQKTDEHARHVLSQHAGALDCFEKMLRKEGYLFGHESIEGRDAVSEWLRDWNDAVRACSLLRSSLTNASDIRGNIECIRKRMDNILEGASSTVPEVEIDMGPSLRNTIATSIGCRFRIVDTPGADEAIQNEEQSGSDGFLVATVRRQLKQAQAIVLLLDVECYGNKSQASLQTEIVNCVGLGVGDVASRVHVMVNRCDGDSPAALETHRLAKEKAAESLKRTFGKPIASVHTISAMSYQVGTFMEQLQKKNKGNVLAMKHIFEQANRECSQSLSPSASMERKFVSKFMDVMKFDIKDYYPDTDSDSDSDREDVNAMKRRQERKNRKFEKQLRKAIEKLKASGKMEQPISLLFNIMAGKEFFGEMCNEVESVASDLKYFCREMDDKRKDTEAAIDLLRAQVESLNRDIELAGKVKTEFEQENEAELQKLRNSQLETLRNEVRQSLKMKAGQRHPAYQFIQDEARKAREKSQYLVQEGWFYTSKGRQHKEVPNLMSNIARNPSSRVKELNKILETLPDGADKNSSNWIEDLKVTYDYDSELNNCENEFVKKCEAYYLQKLESWQHSVEPIFRQFERSLRMRYETMVKDIDRLSLKEYQTSSASISDFKCGDHVIIEGLSEAKYNGMEAIVRTTTDQEVHVEVATSEILRLLPENLSKSMIDTEGTRIERSGDRLPFNKRSMTHTQFDWDRSPSPLKCGLITTVTFGLAAPVIWACHRGTNKGCLSLQDLTKFADENMMTAAMKAWDQYIEQAMMQGNVEKLKSTYTEKLEKIEGHLQYLLHNKKSAIENDSDGAAVKTFSSRLIMHVSPACQLMTRAAENLRYLLKSFNDTAPDGSEPGDDPSVVIPR